VPGTVVLERDGALAVLTLSKPPLNLFDRALLDDLRAAVDEIAANPPRGLLVRAEGRAVSGGVDVHLFDGLSVDDAAPCGASCWTSCTPSRSCRCRRCSPPTRCA
jgi:enoyl-CoA hydratase